MPLPSSLSISVRFALALVPAAVLVACATGGSETASGQPASEVGATEPDGGSSSGDSGESAEASSSSSSSSGEAGSDGASTSPVIGGCRIGRVANADACDEACDARLTLPAKGGTYCTVQCGAPADCNAPASGLACPTDVGACMPRCTTDAACKAMGFARCVLSAGACDTI